MSKLLIKIFDEKNKLLNEKTIESNSKYFTKRVVNNLLENTPGSDSYLVKTMDKVDK